MHKRGASRRCEQAEAVLAGTLSDAGLAGPCAPLCGSNSGCPPGKLRAPGSRGASLVRKPGGRFLRRGLPAAYLRCPTRAFRLKSALFRPLLEAAVALALLLGAARLLTGLFQRKTYRYCLTAARQLRLATWPLLALTVALSVLPMLSSVRTGLEAGLVLALLAVVAALAGPALLLHARYYALNAGTELLFEPEANRFEVWERGHAVPFRQRDLCRVERVTCRARRSFWHRYDYLRLHLADGRVLTFTSLLTDLEPLTRFLASAPLTRRAVRWCWV